MASPPRVGSNTTASVPARWPPDRFLEEAGSAELSAPDPESCEPFAAVVVSAGAGAAVSCGAGVGAARDAGRVVELVAAGAVVVDAGSATPAAALVAGGAPATTTTVPFIQGCGAQW